MVKNVNKNNRPANKLFHTRIHVDAINPSSRKMWTKTAANVLKFIVSTFGQINKWQNTIDAEEKKLIQLNSYV